MFYTATLSKDNPESLPALNVDLDHFVLAGGKADDHRLVMSWHAQLAAIHLRILRENLAARTYAVELTDIFSCLELLSLVPESILEQYLTHPRLCRWINDILSILHRAADRDERFHERLFELPALLLGLFKLLDADFHLQAYIPDTVAPIGTRWGIQASRSGWVRIDILASTACIQIRDAHDVNVTIPFTSLELRESGRSIVSKENWTVYDRYYVQDATEIADWTRYPYFSWDKTRFLAWDEVQTEVLTSLDESFMSLDKAWPEAFAGVLTYSRVLAVASPCDLNSNNSSSDAQQTFLQAIEVPLLNPLKNLESIVHEMSHAKLTTLMAAHRLYLNSDQDLSFRHPWMDRPRPIRGVLLGTHAFLNVLEMYNRLAKTLPQHEQFCRKQVQLRIKEVEETLFYELPKGQFTSQGSEFVNLMQKAFQGIRSDQN